MKIFSFFFQTETISEENKLVYVNWSVNLNREKLRKRLDFHFQQPLNFQIAMFWSTNRTFPFSPQNFLDTKIRKKILDTK